MEAVEVRLRDCVSHAKRLLEPEDGAPLTPGGRRRELTRFFLLAMVFVSLLGNVAYALHHSHEVGAIKTQCDQKTQKQRWEAETRWAAQARDHARVNQEHAALLAQHSKLQEKHSIVKRNHKALVDNHASEASVLNSTLEDLRGDNLGLQRAAELSRQREQAAEAAAARAIRDAEEVRKEVVDLRAALDKLRGDAAEQAKPPAAESSADAPPAPVAPCEDDATWYYSGKEAKTCAYVAAGEEKGDHRCKATNTDGARSALEACPRTCGRCSI
jgi:hypothetical protein